MSPRVEAATRLIERGYQVVPLSPGTKACKDDGWLKLVFKPEDFGPNDNIGLRSVNGIVIVDVDAAEAVAMADAFLPHTPEVWGRPSKPKAKRVFRCAGIDKTLPLKDLGASDDDKAMLVEVRVNHQDMAPPSIHPEGEQLDWYGRGEPAEVEAAALIRDAKLLATAALVARNYPNPGGRHDWTLALAGAMRDMGVSEEEAQKVIEAAGRHVEDNKLDDRRREVRTTYEREEDAPRTSARALKELSDNKFVESLQRIWGMKRLDRNGFKTSKEGAVLVNDPANVVHALKLLNVTARYDVFAQRNLVTRDGQEAPFNDHTLIGLRMEISRRFNFLVGKELLADVIIDQAYARKFHPVLDYLDGLTWDGTPRIDTWLTTYLGAEKQDFTDAISSIVLMAAVRRVRKPGCKFDELVILIGKQGKGKSQAVAALCPDSAWFSDDLPLNSDAKETIERTAGKWVIEAGELVGKRDQDVEKLKVFASRQVDGPVRMAYAHVPSQVERQFIIIGSTNNHKFLTDTTGNRRYWPVKVGELKLKELRRDRDQLWAEAAHREAAGESIRLAQKLWEAAAKEQENATIEEPWLDILEDWLAGDECRNPNLLTVAGVWLLLQVPRERQNTTNGARLSKVMQRLGFHKAIEKLDGNGEVDNQKGTSTRVWKRDGTAPPPRQQSLAEGEM